MSHAVYNDDDAKWAAFVARDPDADRLFFAGVTSTGIFCRSICPARPKRKNVRFLDSREACLKAGFRACKRCKP